MYLTKRQEYNLLKGQLDTDFQSFLPQYRELGDYFLPSRPRLDKDRVNRGDRRNQKIIDGTGTFAAQTLSSGMMSGGSSPARPWFALSTPDPELAEYWSVKDWLEQVTTRMRAVFTRSNLYHALPTTYLDLGVFGTSAIGMEQDFDQVVRFYPYPVGSYRIANNARLKVDVWYREWKMTVAQLVQAFGKLDEKTGRPDWSNFSDRVKSFWDNGRYHEWIDVTHVITPNIHYRPERADKRSKKYASCHFESGVGMGDARNGAQDLFLRESGYDFFPILVPRWQVCGEDVYATSCPGMTALGDNRALQLLHRRAAQALELLVKPPMKASGSLANGRPSILPGETTYFPDGERDQVFEPSYKIEPRLDHLRVHIEDHQNRIMDAFHTKVFLMMERLERGVTAREVEERHEEKLLILGPVVEQLNQDLYDPLIDNTFTLMQRFRLLPPAPRELQGVPLKVEYLSPMAQAQKTVGISSIERFFAFVGKVASESPAPEQVWDKVDSDQGIDVYGSHLSISPKVIRTDDSVKKIREGRAAAQREEAQADVIRQEAAAAKDLSQIDTQAPSALNEMIRQARAGELVAPN